MADIRIVPASSIMSFTSSLNYIEKITQDASGSLNLYGSGSTGRTEILSVDGNNGRLFTVSDDLSDSLFSVNTIAGLPVIEAFANNTVVLGQYGQNVLVITGSKVGIATATPRQKLDVSGSDALINDVTVGRGAGNIASNTAIGSGSLRSNTTGYSNVAVGANTLVSVTGGAANTAIGESALKNNTGNGNTVIGRYAGFDNTSGNVNILIGTSLNYQPDATTFNGSCTLSIGKNSVDLEGYPHIWAPDTVVVSNSTNTTILTVDPSTYSGFFLEYVFDDTNGLMRSGTIKAIFTSTMSGVQWAEVDVLSIGNSSGATFSVVDNGSSDIDVKLNNNTGNTIFCNFTSRLILRQL